MKELLRQSASILGAGFAAACCLGVASALAVLSAVGAGFLIHDAFLIPFYLLMPGLSAWLLYRSARAHGNLTPFRTSDRMAQYDVLYGETLEEVLNELPFRRHGLSIGSQREKDALR